MKMEIIIQFLDKDIEGMKHDSRWTGVGDGKLQEKFQQRKKVGDGGEDFSEAKMNAWLRE